MTEIKVLVEGYAKKIKEGWLASSTVTLVKTNDKNIIIDPGCNRKRLIEELQKNNLKTKDIDFVLLTHSHTDHTLLAGIFENAEVLNNEEIYSDDKQVEHHNKIKGTDLEIIQTPGHSNDHCSLIIRADKIYAVAGDVFWWTDDEKQKVIINKPDQAHSCDMKKLIESRKRILDIADWIIPGHGKMFKVEK